MTSPSDLALASVIDLIEELRRRNLSFIFGWVDHLQFTKDPSQANEIVWGVDHGGALPLKMQLLKLLTMNLEQIEREKTIPGTTEA